MRRSWVLPAPLRGGLVVSLKGREKGEGKRGGGDVPFTCYFGDVASRYAAA